MIRFHFLQDLLNKSACQNYPELIKEWNVTDGAKSVGGYSFTLSNSITGQSIEGLSLDDVTALEKFRIDMKVKGYKDLYDFCDLINDKFAKDRTNRIVDLLTPELLDTLEEKELMPPSKYNGGEPKRDIDFLRGVNENGAREQNIRARVYALFSYDSKATRKIVNFCNTQARDALKRNMLSHAN